MDFKDGIKQMINNIELYEKKSINLYSLNENLWGLYELIDGSSNQNFSKDFHEQWDYIEEVLALEKEEQYKYSIDNTVIPKLKILLKKMDGREF